MTWFSGSKAQLTAQKELEKALMNREDMRAALNRYVASLDLQGQLNAGKITETQANELFQRAILQFSFVLRREINQRFTPEYIDQNNLTNPINLTNAINTPNSFTSTLFNDAADAVVNIINSEAAENEVALNQQAVMIQQTTEEEKEEKLQAQNIPTPKPEPTHHHEKEAVLVTAVLGATLGKEALEHEAEKYFGKKLGNELGKFEKAIDPTKKDKSPFDIPELKPKFIHDEKK